MSEDDTGLATLAIAKPNLTEDTMVKLANELAKAQREPEDVLESFSLSVSQFTTHIENNPFFQQVYAAAVQDWNSATSAAKRIKIKSAASLESSLTTLHQRLNDPQSALPAVVDTAKLLATLAGVGDTKQAPAGSGERFSININIGSKKIESAVEPTIDLTPQPALEKPND
jgi:hypothetical protein